MKGVSARYEHLKVSTEYMKFLKYITVKMIRGGSLENRWIEYVEVMDDPNISAKQEELLNRAVEQGILVRHKSMLRFRLNSIFHAFLTLS